MPQVIIASQLDEPFNQAIRERLPDARVIGIAAGLPDRLPEGASVLLARPVNVRGFVAAPQAPSGWPHSLRWIQLVSSGIDAYPAWLLEGLPVTTSRGTAAQNIAEFALASIFSAAKGLPELWVHEPEQWAFRPLKPLKGSVLGLYGFGAIGQSLATKALALGLEVIALRRSDTPFEVPGVRAARDLHELFALSDHLVLAAPLTPATRQVIDRDVLGSAKPGLHLLNLARGALLDHDALLDALDSGQIGLASLDVTDPEPLPAGHRFYQHPRVRLSPHTAAISSNSRSEIADSFVANVQRFLSEQPLHNLVDLQRGY